MKACVCGGGGQSASSPGRFNPGKNPMVHTGQEAGWAQEPVWTTSRREILAPTSTQTPTP
jgi:hypothetical protein